MDKSLAGLIGAVGTLAAVAPAHALPAQQMPAQDAMQVRSYSDLLKPIPNALELLKAQEAQGGEATLQPVQLVIAPPRQYHHHHHHAYRRPVYHHHHHHHHHHQRPLVVVR